MVYIYIKAVERMHIYFDQLVRDLQNKYSVQTFNVSPQIVTGIEMMPGNVDENIQTLNKDIAYICEYRKLARCKPIAIRAPLICVIEPETDVERVFFKFRTVAAVRGGTVSEVLLALLNLTYKYGLMSSTLTDISQSLLKCGSFQELADEGYRILENPIIVTDSSQVIRAYTDPEAVASPIFEELLALERMPTSHPRMKPISPDNYATYINTEPLITDGDDELPGIICKALTYGGRIKGYLHIPQLKRNFAEKDVYAAELLGNLLTSELLNNPVAGIPSKAERWEKFLRDILDNTPWSLKNMREQLENVGLELRKCQYTIVIRASGDLPTPRASLYDTARLITDALPDCIGFLYRNSVFLLFGTDREITDFGEALSPIIPLLVSYGLIAGVSNMFSSIQQLRRSDFQSRRALQLGSALHKNKTIYLYRDYMLYNMIEICLKDESLEMYCPPEIFRLLAHCESNGPELLDTLNVYLRCDRSKSRTAMEMFLHVNTIKYRVNQIQDILGLDLDSDENVIRLTLSLKMLEYHDAFPVYPPPLS